MKIKFHNRYVVCCAFVIAGTAIAGVFAKQITGKRALVDTANDTGKAISPLNTSTTTSTRVKAVGLTLTSSGFEPQSIEQPKGPFFLAVINRTSADGLVFTLERELGGQMKEIKLDARKRRGAALLDLPPGRYVLTEPGHPDWVCRISITPQ